MGIVVNLKDLRMAYGGQVVLEVDALTISSGMTTVLLGPNGSGKSTLLAAIAGLKAPVAGTVRVLGDPPGTRTPEIATVLQATESGRLLPMSVQEVVMMGRYARLGMFRRRTAADRSAVAGAMERMDITDIAGSQLRELSGGQRQRALVAQGLAQEADVLLLDEPATGLDLPSQQAIAAAVAAERDRGVAVVISSHDLRDAEQADQVVLLAGRVVAAGPPDAALSDVNLRSAYGHRLLDLGGALAIDEHVHH